MIDRFLGDNFRAFSNHFGACSSVCCSAADTNLKLTTRPCCQWCLFSNWGVSLSVALLIVELWQYCVCSISSGVTGCTVFMVLDTRRSLVANWNTYAAPRCITSNFHKTFIPLSVSLWNDLGDPVFWRCGTGRFPEQGQCFFISLSCIIRFFYILVFFPFWSSVYRLLRETGVFGLIGWDHSLTALHCQPHIMIMLIITLQEFWVSAPGLLSILNELLNEHLSLWLDSRTLCTN